MTTDINTMTKPPCSVRARRCEHMSPPQLASITSASHLQDRSARVQVCPWCCSCIPTGTLCPGRRRLRASTATVCIYSMYSVIKDEDVNGTAKFCVPWAVSLEQLGCHQLCETAVCLWERSKRGWRRITLVVDNNEHRSALLGRC